MTVAEITYNQVGLWSKQAFKNQADCLDTSVRYLMAEFITVSKESVSLDQISPSRVKSTDVPVALCS